MTFFILIVGTIANVLSLLLCLIQTSFSQPFLGNAPEKGTWRYFAFFSSPIAPLSAIILTIMLWLLYSWGYLRIVQILSACSILLLLLLILALTR